MRRHRSSKTGRPDELNVFIVDALVPDPAYAHEPLPEQVLGIALDQRAFGPQRLMVAFAAVDGRFLALTYTERTAPIEPALRACLLHFDALGRGGEGHVAAVALCDEAVHAGPPPPQFTTTFERAKDIAQQHGVHLVDWIACDDDLFRCARMRTFRPADEPGWWDVPDLAG